MIDLFDYEFRVEYEFEHQEVWNTPDYVKIIDDKKYVLESINGISAKKIFEECNDNLSQKVGYVDERWDEELGEELEEELFYEWSSCSTIEELTDKILQSKNR